MFFIYIIKYFIDETLDIKRTLQQKTFPSKHIL